MDKQEDSAMESATTTSVTTSVPPHDEPAPVTAAGDRPVEVDASGAHIHDLTIERPSIVAYLRAIPESKQEIALLHALEVGITELAARRERFKH